MAEALRRTFGTHLYLRERYARSRGKQKPIRIRKRKSYSGLRSNQPFLVLKAAGHRLFLTPRRFWLHAHGEVISGATQTIALETFHLEEKVSRPREDDEILRSTYDAFRQFFVGGTAIRSFCAFNPDNDPYHEHDFGAVEIDGEKYFFKIDAYDRSMEVG